MDIDNLDIIRNLISNGEGMRVEFKETTWQLERGMETLCAFLNSEGGTVLFGVTDKGKIIGQDVSDKTKREIAEAIGKLEPAVAVQVVYISLPDNEKQVIALHVEEARLERPFSYKNRAYVRMESTTTVMTQQMYNELLIMRDGGKYRWELFEDKDLELSDMDENEILKTVRLGITCGRLPENIGNNIPVILEKFGLMKKGVLNHAAAVLFANREMVEYPQCLLRLARFRGTDKMEFIDSQRIYGNVFQLLDAAMAFLFKHLLLSGKIEGLEREEHLSVPYKAVREGVLNALAHRSYREPGGSVGVAIYDDRVEIENPGAFPHGWDVERMVSEHCSEPQNPVIANVLYKRKLLESWGRGIGLMEEECRKAGLPAPEYKLGNGFVVLVFRYGEVAHSSDNQVPHGYPTVTPRLPHAYPTVTPQIRKVIVALGDNALSPREIMDEIGLKDKGNFLAKYLKPAIDLLLVEPLYAGQMKYSPKQKYQLTEQGRAVLQDGDS